MDPVTMGAIGSAVMGGAGMMQAGAQRRAMAAQQAQQSLAQSIAGITGAPDQQEISPLERLWQQIQGGQGMRF